MQVMSGLIVIENVLAWPNVNTLITKALPLPARQSPFHLRACSLPLGLNQMSISACIIGLSQASMAPM